MTATRRPRRLARLFTGAALAVGALVGAAAAPAAAFDQGPEAAAAYQDTTECPCSGGKLDDPYGGTFFGHDAGGYGVKLNLTQGTSYLGKVEFHPDANQLRVFDARNDRDTFYVHVSTTTGGVTHDLGTYNAPSTGAPVDTVVKDLDVPEGTPVDIAVYDDPGLTQYIGGARGTGAAVA